MAIFEALSSGFVVLVIASFFVIVVGFLWDSTEAEAGGAEPIEPPPPSNLPSAIWNFALAGLWGYFYLRDEWGQPDWLMIGVISLFVLVGLFHLYKYVTVERAAK